MKIALHGASGRMGAALLSLVRDSGDVIVGAVAAPGTPGVGRDLGEAHGAANMGVEIQDNVAAALLGANVVIDFSHASAVERVAREASRAGVALVSGTTGLDPAAVAALDAAASTIPVLWAPNFSLGIQVLVEVARHAVTRLGSAFDIEIVETHHRAKADAPSGTAARLAQELQAVRPELELVYGREGLVGARRDSELAVFAMRGGDVLGDHTIHLFGAGERLELTHRATSRAVFAQGALFAARAVASRHPGRYSLADVLPPL